MTALSHGCKSLDPLQNSMMVKSTITLGILKLHDLIYSTNPRPKTNFLKHTCSARYSGETNALEQSFLPCKKSTAVSEFKSKLLALCLLLDLSDFLICMHINMLKLHKSHYILQQNFAHHSIHTKLTEMCKFLLNLNYPVKISKKNFAFR